MVGRKRKNPTTAMAGDDDVEGEVQARSSPHFFKVFLPSLSAHHLKIPPAFGQHIHSESLGMISLRGPSGKIWRVELVENSEGFCLENGWKEFVSDHSVVAGDFLVFRYESCTQFSVLVFDTTSCEKESAFLAQPLQGMTVKKELDEEEVEIMPEGGSKAFVCSSREIHGANLKRVVAADDDLIRPLKKECNFLETATEKWQKKTAARMTSIHAATCPACAPDSDKSKKCSSLQFRKSSDVVQRDKAPGRVQRMAVLISHRRPITEEEKYETLQRAMSFKSENPFTVQIMKASYVYVGFFLNIPCDFTREHLPQISRKMTLWDPEGKPWKVNYIYYADRCVGSFSGGWGTFACANNLEMCDVCVFELIKRNNIKVHIYRVVPEITPLTRRSGRK